MKIKLLLYLILGCLLPLALLLTSVEIVVFNTENYIRGFERYNISDVTGMDKNNLKAVTEDILLYLEGQKNELDSIAVIKGEEKEVFSQRDRLHMVDVQNIFLNVNRIRNGSLIISVILLIILLKTDAKWKKNLSKTLIIAVFASILILAALFLMTVLDFNKYFTYFHFIFFDNDLWLLDPAKDMLIQMFPEAFFLDMTRKIIYNFLYGLILMGIAGFFICKKSKAANSIVFKLF